MPFVAQRMEVVGGHGLGTNHSGEVFMTRKLHLPLRRISPFGVPLSSAWAVNALYQHKAHTLAKEPEGTRRNEPCAKRAKSKSRDIR